MFFLILRKNAAKQQASFSTLRKRFSAMQHPRQEMITLDKKEIPRQRRLPGATLGLSRKLLCTGISPGSPMAADGSFNKMLYACTVLRMCALLDGKHVSVARERGFPPRLQRQRALLLHHSACPPLTGLKAGTAVYPIRDGSSTGASPRRRAVMCPPAPRAQSLRISLKAPLVGAANAILAPEIQQILEIAKSPLILPPDGSFSEHLP